MTRLELLQQANPHLPIHSVHDPAFTPYGRLIGDFGTTGLTAATRAAAAMPAAGSRYLPVLECLDTHPDAAALRDLYWGQLDAQIGLCWGHAGRLSALEWHASSEINIGVTDLVLLLADRREMRGGWLDSSCVEAFYLDEGEIIEMYATTLHFCPCQVDERGFSCIVALPRGTNTPLDPAVHTAPFLWAKNKWLAAHEDNAQLLRRGATAGIRGTNWTLVPIKEKEI